MWVETRNFFWSKKNSPNSPKGLFIRLICEMTQPHIDLTNLLWLFPVLLLFYVLSRRRKNTNQGLDAERHNEGERRSLKVNDFCLKDDWAEKIFAPPQLTKKISSYDWDETQPTQVNWVDTGYSTPKNEAVSIAFINHTLCIAREKCPTFLQISFDYTGSFKRLISPILHNVAGQGGPRLRYPRLRHLDDQVFWYKSSVVTPYAQFWDNQWTRKDLLALLWALSPSVFTYEPLEAPLEEDAEDEDECKCKDECECKVDTSEYEYEAATPELTLVDEIATNGMEKYFQWFKDMWKIDMAKLKSREFPIRDFYGVWQYQVTDSNLPALQITEVSSLESIQRNQYELRLDSTGKFLADKVLYKEDSINDAFEIIQALHMLRDMGMMIENEEDEPQREEKESENKQDAEVDKEKESEEKETAKAKDSKESVHKEKFSDVARVEASDASGKQNQPLKPQDALHAEDAKNSAKPRSDSPYPFPAVERRDFRNQLARRDIFGHMKNLLMETTDQLAQLKFYIDWAANDARRLSMQEESLLEENQEVQGEEGTEEAEKEEEPQTPGEDSPSGLAGKEDPPESVEQLQEKKPAKGNQKSSTGLTPVATVATAVTLSTEKAEEAALAELAESGIQEVTEV